MRRGEEFEIRCYEYLKQFYKIKNIDFSHEGGMDSTKSDIAVIKNGKIKFYIEAKDIVAQSGQFVLLPDENTETFIFSPRNKSKENEMTDIIIRYMNSDFQRFNHAGTAGKCLDIDANVFANWIIQQYKGKNVKYVISFDRDYVIFPIHKFQQYFDIQATYRVKKSGSSVPAKKDIEIIKQCVKHDYNTARFRQEQKKLYVEITETIKKEKFILGNYTYYFSKQNLKEYEIRKLSNTYHMNVIFSIKLRKTQDESDLKAFEAEL